jgi:hypothetical protein
MTIEASDQVINAYLADLEAVDRAAQEKDLDAAQETHVGLASSRMACHQQHRCMGRV